MFMTHTVKSSPKRFSVTKTEPWSIHGGVGVPFWDMLPSLQGDPIRDDYEERASIMEFCGAVAREVAEQMAYCFMFADTPDLISPFVSDEQNKTQLLRARTFRGKREIELQAEIRDIWKTSREGKR